MSARLMASRWSDVLLTALAPAIWGSTYIVTTQLLPPDRPFTAALLRVLPAGLLLILAGRHLPRRGEWGRLLVLSALNIGVFQALLFVAAYRLPGGLAAVLGATQPLLVMGLAWGWTAAARREWPPGPASPGWRAWRPCCCRRARSGTASACWRRWAARRRWPAALI